MSSLAEFLIARIAEDEADAKAASEGGLFQFSMWEVGRSRHQVGFATVKDVGRPAENASDTTPEYAAHSARWDPRRVLDECKAKRRIVELAEEATGLDMQVDSEFRVGSRDEIAEPYVGDLILASLALPYSYHPDYRDEWRP